MPLSPAATAATVQGMLDLDSCSPPRPVSAPERNPLPAGMVALLASLGVASVADRDEVTDVVERELTARDLTAEIVGVRHGTLRLRACPQQATFLRYEVTRLLERLEAAVPGVVSHVVVEVDRGSRAAARPGPSVGQA